MLLLSLSLVLLFLLLLYTVAIMYGKRIKYNISWEIVRVANSTMCDGDVAEIIKKIYNV